MDAYVSILQPQFRDDGREGEVETDGRAHDF